MKRMKAQTVFLAVLLCTCLFSCSADVAGPHAAGDSVRVDPPSEEDAQFYDVGQTIQVKAIDKADPRTSPWCLWLWMDARCMRGCFPKAST